MVTRRTLLKRGAAGALTLAGARWLRPGVAAAAPFTQALRFPPVLTDPEITVPIEAGAVPIRPGAATRMWTFAGSFPGPTIRRPTGATTRVTFAHRLPAAGSLTIHHHGHHNRAVDDGQPVSQLIEPGHSRTYTYRHVEDGRPLRGAMRFYHDHSHGRTGRSSWMGLVGLFVLDDPAEAKLGLPGPERELLLVVSETTLTGANQLTDPFKSPADPGGDGVGMGETVLVNGVPQPYVVLEPTRYRLRVLNASSFNPYNLGFEKGPALVQVGNESGLLPAPLDRDRVLLGPAERCDVVVDFSKHAGRNLVLSSAPQEPRPGAWGALAAAPARPADVLQVRVRGTAVASRPVPKKLVALPKWVADLPQQPDRILAFGRGIDPADPSTQQVWTINGRAYDPSAPVARPELGSTETWLLVNATAQSHYVHLHDVDWKLIQRNGAAPDPWEDALKETFRLDPGDTVLVGTKFTDHLGTYMVHCHMLSHEDHAMMAPFEVVKPGAGDRPSSPLDPLTFEEATRVRAMLAAQAASAGRPAPVPAEPLVLAPGSAAFCRLPEARSSR